MTTLASGSAHITKIQKLLHDFLSGENLKWTINTDEATAYGTDVQANILEKNKTMSRMWCSSQFLMFRGIITTDTIILHK